jgi:TonB-linked SusC/RagA family outer membrane protein
MLLCVISLQAQVRGVAPPQTTIEAIIVNENGKPVVGARIYGNEGATETITDANGKFTVTIPVNTPLLIECKGYETLQADPALYSDAQKITLVGSEPLFGKNDIVDIAFAKIPKGNVIHSASFLNPNDILDFDYVRDFAPLISGRTVGMLGGSNMRGTGTPVYIIDGLPRDPTLLNVEEIESISVLKDINSAILYGCSPINGVVLINTKRGAQLKREIKVSAYYGLSKPRALPKYLSSADYMEQYNIARANDGLDLMYSDEMIRNFRSGNPYRYPNTDYFSSDFIQSVKPYSKVLLELSGGNKIASYYSDLSWEYEDNLMKFGYAKDLKLNSFNARGNLDLQINDWLKTSIDATGLINRNGQPYWNYWSRTVGMRPDLFTPLIPIDLIDPELSLLKGAKRIINGKYLPGGNSSYNTNPITDNYLLGGTVIVWRNYSFTNRIDADLSRFVEGLQLHTNLCADYMNIYTEYLQNDYATFEAVWDPSEDKIVDLKKYGEDRRTGTQNVTNSSGRRRFGFYVMIDYNRRFGELHNVSANLLGFASHIKNSADIQPSVNTNLGFRMAYNYADKYMVDFSSAVVRSLKLHPDNRTAFSPSIGLAWIASKEEFLKNSDKIDYLKLKLSGGIMNTDEGINSYFLYDNRYTTSTGFYWYDGGRSRSTYVPSFGGNPNLEFEKIKDFNIGLEGQLFDRRLTFDVNYFNRIRSNMITRITTSYPNWFSMFIPYENYNEYAYRGFELGLKYETKINELGIMLESNILYNTSEIRRLDESYAYGYQYHKGNPVDARYGLVDDGFFQSQQEIDGYALSAFGAVQPGDIKYKDLNGDNIVDDNDQQMIGRWQVPLYFGLQAKLDWKRMTLFAMATAQHGADGYLGDASYNNYYWIQGDNKYSNYMLNHWTEETKTTATYPRISTRADNNNFRSSTFWLFNSDRINIDRIQLSYDVPLNKSNILKLKRMSVFANISNILTIAPNKDILILNIGSEPQYRSFAVGLKTLF